MLRMGIIKKEKKVEEALILMVKNGKMLIN
jgi:hypothetical protein